jgi:hypothetical protein
MAGRCPRHPMFDPEVDGPGAIRGGYSRCQELQTIFESRQRTLGLMRTFAPSSSAQRRKPADPDAERQQDLFGPLRDPCSAPIY